MRLMESFGGASPSPQVPNLEPQSNLRFFNGSYQPRTTAWHAPQALIMSEYACCALIIWFASR